ncbi:hypothetical protein [Persicitalea sp.]|uniref:hypothetical protein n=1 Tax=Persicitalea sp. TaxID=3100273 RepID=UPI003593C764
MIDVHDLSDILKLVAVDYRAEAVVRELIEEGVGTLDNTLIMPEGGFQRAFAREVKELSPGYDYENEARNFIKVNTRREGVTDMIPAGIIFLPNIDREERTTEVMLEDAELHDSEYRDARRFFLPFDAEFGRQRLTVEQFEHQSITNTYANYSQELYELLWPDLDLELTDFQKATLLEITMEAHHLSGDYPACGRYLEKILGHPVRIESGPMGELYEGTQPSVSTQGTYPSLGGGTLGVDWIPFDSHRDTSCVRIRVGPVPAEDMTHYRQHLPLGRNYRLLAFLCDLLLPVELSWIMQLIPGEGEFRINRTKEAAVLGYSTILG